MNKASNFTLEDYVRILNQYQELQQENQKLKEQLESIDKHKMLLDIISVPVMKMKIEDIEKLPNYLDLYNENKKLKDRIEKAIEYIENNPLYEEEYDYNYEDELYLSGIDDDVASETLIAILKGEENNNLPNSK